jgi:hypothetical protein
MDPPDKMRGLHLNFYLEIDYWELLEEVSFFTTNSFWELVELVFRESFFYHSLKVFPKL